MRTELISFQKKAVDKLRKLSAKAIYDYQCDYGYQVVSFQAPTGSGKTIMMSALIESIFKGCVTADGKVFEEQPEAVFVWLSDSPELNEQSKQKIENATTLRYGQCVMIDESDFDRETFEDGHVYFLNTQKISKNGNLTKHADGRTYTIWDTVNNTIEEKSDRFYFIIDEAHRGAKSKQQSGTDTTIMQRFIKGWEYYENGIKKKLNPCPVVIGMSATAERFNTLIGKSDSALQKCIVTSDEVKASGLLKDRIVITYPDDSTKNNDMALLEAAIDEWQKKCLRWEIYYNEQHSAKVDPVFVIQVSPGTGGKVSDTNLEDMLSKIEEKIGYQLNEYEIVHCFGSTGDIEVNGLKIHHVNASDIAADHKIKIVLFKEALSTGWDCPRAEAMMSYRRAVDATYIAQLLGRMVRTPLQTRVQRDDSLNDVKLYLPHFDRNTVENVIKEFRSSEGGDIPTEINGEPLDEPVYITYTLKPPRQPRQTNNPQDDPNQARFGTSGESYIPSTQSESQETNNSNQSNQEGTDSETPAVPQNEPKQPESTPLTTVNVPVDINPPAFTEQTGEQLEFTDNIDREGIQKYINDQGYLTYFIRKDRINDYLKSLINLATLLSHYSICINALDEVEADIVELIHDYVSDLHNSGKYEEEAKAVITYKLLTRTFDTIDGEQIPTTLSDFELFSESDIDRQYRSTKTFFGGEGVAKEYSLKYGDDDDANTAKIDCILFANDESCRTKLGNYAKQKLYYFSNKYRLDIVNKSDYIKNRYREIMADSDTVSEQIFVLPDNPKFKEDSEGTEFSNHLFASEITGKAKLLLNGWEKELIDYESKKPDFVCWLRNPNRATWGLCIPYEYRNETLGFHPDFLIVSRRYDGTYVVDILEPHGDQFDDNLAKAKGLARYAKREDRFGRIQLIRKVKTPGGNTHFVRLEFNDREIREKVLQANTNDELKNIIMVYGTVE